MNYSLEYWKKRCELAEKILVCKSINFSVVDKQTFKAYTDWRDFKNSSNAAIEPEETTNGIYPPIEFLTSFLSEEHQENAKRIDEMFFIPDELSNEVKKCNASVSMKCKRQPPIGLCESCSAYH